MTTFEIILIATVCIIFLIVFTRRKPKQTVIKHTQMIWNPSECSNPEDGQIFEASYNSGEERKMFYNYDVD